MAWSHARISFSFVPVNSGCTRSFGNKTIPRRSTCMLPFDLAPKPKMISAPYQCQFLRLRSQNFSSECFDTLENTTRLTSAHWHALLWSTIPFPPRSHAQVGHATARSNRTFFFSCKEKKGFEFALQVSKRLTEKVPVLGGLFCNFFRLCTINTPFWDFEALPICLAEKARVLA